MSLTKIIKSQARAALSGFRGRAVAILAVTVLLQWGANLLDAAVFRFLGYDVQLNFTSGSLSYAQSFVQDPLAITVCVATCFVRIILLVPLGLGAVNWYLELTDRRAQPVSYLFWPYESKAYFRSIGLWLNLLVKFLVYGALIWWAPTFCLAFGAEFLLPGGLMGMNDLAVGAMILTASLPFLVLLWTFMGRYDLARVLLCQKYRMTVRQAVRTSVRMMRGNKWLLLRFKLSFFWWYLPAAVLLGGSLWMMDRRGWEGMFLLAFLAFCIYSIAAVLVAVPYYRMSHTMICRYLYEAGTREESGPPQSGTPVETGSDAPETAEKETDPLGSPIIVPQEPPVAKEERNDSKYYL